MQTTKTKLGTKALGPKILEYWGLGDGLNFMQVLKKQYQSYVSL